MDNYYERLNQAFANWNGGEPSLDDRVAALESEMLQKQDILTFDTEPVEDSENPVTSGGLFSQFGRYATKTALNDKVDISNFTADRDRQETEIGVVASLGAKNNADFKFGGVVPNVNVKPGTIVCIESNGTFSFSGTSDNKNYAAYVLKQFLLKAGTYKVSGISGGSNTTYWMRIGTGATDTALFNLYDGERELNLSNDTLITVQIVIYTNQTVSNLVFKPMIRRSEITDDTFAPYAPTNRELYEMILALQSGS